LSGTPRRWKKIPLPGEVEHAAAEQFLGRRPWPYALLHYQGTSCRAKKDLTEKIAGETSEELVATGVTPIVLDLRHGSRLNPEWLVHEAQPPLVAAALSAGAMINVGIDSGPGHIFAACGSPTVIGCHEHHPYHFFEPSPHVVHVVPDDHHRLLKPGGKSREFFERHCRYLPDPRPHSCRLAIATQ
jgi:ADP-heptose:LPS heptosyltransferase